MVKQKAGIYKLNEIFNKKNTFLIPNTKIKEAKIHEKRNYIIRESKRKIRGQSENKKQIYFIESSKKGQTSPYPKESQKSNR